MNRTALITGAGGFVGHILRQYLADRGTLDGSNSPQVLDIRTLPPSRIKP